MLMKITTKSTKALQWDRILLEGLIFPVVKLLTFWKILAAGASEYTVPFLITPRNTFLLFNSNHPTQPWHD